MTVPATVAGVDIPSVRAQLLNLRDRLDTCAPTGQQVHPPIAHHIDMTCTFLAGLDEALRRGPTYWTPADTEALRHRADPNPLYASTRSDINRLRDRAFEQGLATATRIYGGEL